MTELPDITKDIAIAMDYWVNFVNSLPREITNTASYKTSDMAKELLKKWLDTQIYFGVERCIDERIRAEKPVS